MPIEIINSVIPTVDDLENKIVDIQQKYENGEICFVNDSQNNHVINTETSLHPVPNNSLEEIISETKANTSSASVVPNKSKDKNLIETKTCTEPSCHSTDDNFVETISKSRLISGADEITKNSSIVLDVEPSILERDLNEMSTSKGLSKLSVEKNPTDLLVCESGSKNENGLKTKIEEKGKIDYPSSERDNKDMGNDFNKITMTSKKPNPLSVDDTHQIPDEQNRKLLFEIKSARMKEKEARDIIKAQIAVDKLERDKKFALLKQELIESSNNQQQSSSHIYHCNSNEACLQFRFGNGETLTHNFESNSRLSDIKQFVQDTIMNNSMDFKLATTYPKREFTVAEDNMTLTELNLTPTAVIMVIPTKRKILRNVIAESNIFMNMVNNFLWSVLNPIIIVVNSLKNWLVRRDTNIADNRNNYGSSNMQS